MISWELSRIDLKLQNVIELKEQNIIEHVTFSEWAAPITRVLKNYDFVSICGDFM